MRVTAQPQSPSFVQKVPGLSTVCAVARYFFSMVASAVNYCLVKLHLRTAAVQLPNRADLRTLRKLNDRGRAALANIELAQDSLTIKREGAARKSLAQDQETSLARINAACASNSTSLDLSGLKLTQEDLETLIPHIRAQLPHITKLDLGFNPLTTLPDTLENLTTLTHLNLQSTELNALPAVIYRLQNLTALNLRGNWLRTIPEELAQLPHLVNLNIKRRRAPFDESQVPEALRNKPNLQITGLIAQRDSLSSVIARIQRSIIN